jgi:hypothetical protein
MISILTMTRALAIDVRHIDIGATLGVALVVPSEQYVSILADGDGRAVEPELTPHVWREIDAWAAAGDAGLPARPAPMDPAIVAALLEGERLSVSAKRFASIPISVASHAELAPLAERLLPELLNTRRSAA